MDHCPACPCDPDHFCPGEQAARLCELMTIPAHRDGYRVSILAQSRPRTETDEEMFARIEAARIAYEALPPEQRRSCCNGGAN